MAKLNTILIQICDECLQGASIPPMTTAQATMKLKDSPDSYAPRHVRYREQCRQQGCFYFLQKPPAFYIAPETYTRTIASELSLEAILAGELNAEGTI